MKVPNPPGGRAKANIYILLQKVSNNVVPDLNENTGGSTDLARKRHGSADLRTPIHPPLNFIITISFQELKIM